MQSKRLIDREISDLTAFRDLTQAYAEIASSRMKSTRDTTLKSRDFYAQIRSIFDEVRVTYAREVMRLRRRRRRKRDGEITFLAHNGKEVAVFLSSNTGLYGDIVQKTFHRFLEYISADGAEVTIVGKYGRALFLEEKPGEPYTFFDLPDQGVDEVQISSLIRHVVQYEKIKVFHGKFQSVVSQIADELEVSAQLPEVQGAEEKKGAFIFEPELQKILMFFEREIFASTFEQAVRESQLARFASRVLAMDTAGRNVGDNLEKLTLERLKAIHVMANKKQLNSLGGRLILSR